MDAIIPVMNEQNTIGPILEKFIECPMINGVYVQVDALSSDRTAQIVSKHMLNSWKIIGHQSDYHGKGQLVSEVLSLADGPRVMFCDGDYSNLTMKHLMDMTQYDNGMVIGVPRLPDGDLIPDHVTQSWKLVSGFRVVPRGMIPKRLYGYLMETQLNHAAMQTGVTIDYIYMPDLIAPFHWPLSKERAQAMEDDRDWAKRNLEWFK